MSVGLGRFAQGLSEFLGTEREKESFDISFRSFANRQATQRMRSTPHSSFDDDDDDDATDERGDGNIGTWHPISSPFEDEDDDDDDDAAPTASLTFQLRPVPTSFSVSPLESMGDLNKRARAAGMRPDLYVADQLVRQYQADPTDEKLEHLFSHYKKTVIDKEIRRHTKRRLPEPAVRGRVYNNFVDSVRKFNPDNEEGKSLHEFIREDGFRAGAAVAGGTGKGVAKWADRYSRIGAINHERMNKHQKYQILQEMNQINLGREADAAEIQQQTGWKLKDLSVIMEEASADHIASRNAQDGREDRGLQYRMAIERARERFPRNERKLVDDIIEYQLLSDDQRKQKGLSLGSIGAKYGYSNSRVTAVHNKLQAEVLSERNAFLRFD